MLWKSFAVVESLHEIHSLESRLSPAVRTIANPSLSFVFTGQGAQWAKMGQGLLCFPEFSKSLRQAEEYLLTLGCRWRLREEMFKPADESKINKPEFSQPLVHGATGRLGGPPGEPGRPSNGSRRSFFRRDRCCIRSRRTPRLAAPG